MAVPVTTDRREAARTLAAGGAVVLVVPAGGGADLGPLHRMGGRLAVFVADAGDVDDPSVRAAAAEMAAELFARSGPGGTAPAAAGAPAGPVGAGR